MSSARHQRAPEARRAAKLRAGLTFLTALALGAAVACSLFPASAAVPLSATLTAASVASPAEGHSPRLLNELSGPLDQTGIARPGSSKPVASTLQQATAAASSTTLNGVDVASFQHPNGAAIDWTQVAGAGYDFAAIKATEGSYYVNPYYASDAAAATAAGMYVSAYHFANPADSSGTVQAQYAAQNAGRNGSNYTVGGHYLPLALDLEYDPYSSNECYGVSPSAMVSWIAAFMAEATTLTGAAPIIYTPQAWWDTCTGNSTAFGGDVLWVPAYSAGTPGTLPAGWNTWTMWQYTSSGTVPGIATAADLDYFSGGPQDEQTYQYASVSMQMETLNALAHQQVTYSAAGLPPGVTMSSAGKITGVPTATGTYQVTVTPSTAGSVLPPTISFTWQVIAPPAAATAAAVEGTNGEPYARAPQLGSGWHGLGGKVIAPPAVAAAPNPDGASPVSPLFIAPGTNHLLYIRGVTGSWQRLGPQDAACLSVAAVITGVTLTVACESTGHALYWDEASVPSSGLPQFTRAWRSLGGVLSAGPAVSLVGGVRTFFVRTNSGRIYTRTLSTGYKAAPWTCLGQPAAAQRAATGVTTFACEGTDHQLYVYASGGAGWQVTLRQGGTLAAGPAVAATSAAPVLFAELTNHAVWMRTPSTSWTSLGGSVVGGVEAAALN